VSLSQAIEGAADLSGTTVALTVRVRPGVAGAMVAKITDSNGTSSSPASVGTGSYETLTVIRTLGTITSLTISVEMSATSTHYIDNAMFVQSLSPIAYAASSPASDWDRALRFFEKGFSAVAMYGSSDDSTYYIGGEVDFSTIKASDPVIALSNTQVYEDGLGLTNVVSSYTLVLGITDHLFRGFSLKASKAIGGQRPVKVAFNWTASI
jgi:hypothetical protein